MCLCQGICREALLPTVKLPNSSHRRMIRYSVRASCSASLNSIRNASLSAAFQWEISGKRYRTFHRVSRVSFSNCSIASCRLGTCASVQENCWPNRGWDRVSAQCVSTSGARGRSSRRKITP